MPEADETVAFFAETVEGVTDAAVVEVAFSLVTVVDGALEDAAAGLGFLELLEFVAIEIRMMAQITRRDTLPGRLYHGRNALAFAFAPFASALASFDKSLI